MPSFLQGSLPVIGGEGVLPVASAGTQTSPRITGLADGNFLATWIAEGQPGLMAQVVHANGHAVGRPFAVAPPTGAVVTDYTALAVAPDGTVWITTALLTGAGLSVAVTALRLDDSGTPGAPAAWNYVDQTGLGRQLGPSIDILDNGRAVVSWIETPTGTSQAELQASLLGNVKSIILTTPAQTTTGAFSVNNLAYGAGLFGTKTAVLENGNVVVLWDGGAVGTSSNGVDILGQIINANGIKQGSPFVANAITAGIQFNGQVAALDDGNFVVIWQDDGGTTGELANIMARVFRPDGVPVGAGFVVHENRAGVQSNPVVTAVEGGGFFVVWQDESGTLNDPGTGVAGRRFDTVGRAVGTTFQINERVIGTQDAPAVAVSGDRLLVAWQDAFPQGVDPDGPDIRFQMYDTEDELLRYYKDTVPYSGGAPQTTFVVLGASLAMDGDLLVTVRIGFDIYVDRFDSVDFTTPPQRYLVQSNVAWSSNFTIHQDSSGLIFKAYANTNVSVSNSTSFADLANASFGNLMGLPQGWSLNTLGAPQYDATLADGVRVTLTSGRAFLPGSGGPYATINIIDPDDPLNVGPAVRSAEFAASAGITPFGAVSIDWGDVEVMADGRVAVMQTVTQQANFVAPSGVTFAQIQYRHDILIFDPSDKSYHSFTVIPAFRHYYIAPIEDRIPRFAVTSDGIVVVIWRDPGPLTGADYLDITTKVQGFTLDGVPVGPQVVLAPGSVVDDAFSIASFSDGSVAIRRGAEIIVLPVEPENSAPTLMGGQSGPLTAPAGQPLALDIRGLFFDADGDVLTYSVVSQNGMLYIGTDGILRGAPGGSNTSLTLTAHDASGASVSVTLALDTDAPGGTSGPDVLNGLAGNDTLRGLGGDDLISGEAGNDVLLGGPGNDILIGGQGNDRMDGGPGNDRVDFLGPENITVNLNISTAQTTGQGRDTILNVEEIYTGRGHDRLTGTALGNIIFSGAGNDTLSGGAGNDILMAGAGDDQISGGSGNDQINGGAGVDRVVFAGTAATTVHLGIRAAQDTGNGIDTLLGIEHATTGAGNDRLTGNAAANVLSAGDGNDILNGGLGRDTLTGGAGRDLFLFSSVIGPGNVDRITDFAAVDDTIRLDDAVFAGLAPGSLSALRFVANASGVATTASHRIIYETDTGRLVYDADGAGQGAGIHFATLTPALALTHADFFVF